MWVNISIPAAERDYLRERYGSVSQGVSRLVERDRGYLPWSPREPER